MNNKVEFFFPREYDYKKCVLQVICPQHEENIGGSDAYVRDLVLEMVKEKKYTPIVLFPHNYQYRDILKENNIPFIFAYGCKKKSDIVNQLKKFSESYNIKIIHSHQYDANYLTQMLKMFGGNKWKKIPVIMTCHGWIENSLKLKIMTFFDFKSYRYSNTLITVSMKDYNRLKNTKYSKTKNIVYIPNGIIHNKDYSIAEKELIRKKYNIKDNDFIVGYVGRLASEKRIDLLVKVIANVCQKNEKIKFIIAGNGEFKDFLIKEIKQNNWQDRVNYVGYIKNISEIHEILDVILITSDTEGTPRAVLESMSYKTICISTDVGGLKQIIKDKENGFLCDAGNFDEISNKVIHIYDLGDNRNKIKNSAQKSVDDNFLMSKMYEKILREYERIDR